MQTSHRAVLLLQKEVTNSCQLVWYVANNSSFVTATAYLSKVLSSSTSQQSSSPMEGLQCVLYTLNYACSHVYGCVLVVHDCTSDAAA